MSKKTIKVNLGEKGKIKIELDTNSLLSEIRKQLLDTVTFPFLFADEDENEIPNEKETEMKLEDVLDGTNLYLKKHIIKREMLGRKVEPKNGLDFYVYPQRKLTNEEKESSSNIMIIGETGVGKSTWIHSFINYMQSIQLEENDRYYLFDEKSLQEEYQKLHGKKEPGCSVTDTPAIYNIEASMLFKNPIRLIDTAGFGDTRGPQYDAKITEDIKDLFEGSEIENLNAVCLIFKATETRATDRLEMVMNKLFSLFGSEIKKNIIIIFTFCDNFKNIEGLKVLKNKNGPFYKILGNIEEIPYFGFNNTAYFSSDKKTVEAIYENNTKNFGSLLKYIFSLKRISLESSRKVINDRLHIKNNIVNLCDQLNNIMVVIDAASKNQMKLIELQNDLQKYQESKVVPTPYTIQEEYTDVIDKEIRCDSGWYVLYCNNCNRVCHKKCKGSNEGWHSTEYGCNMISTLGHKCSECKCKDNKHRFRESYTIKEEVTRYRPSIRYKIDEKAVQTEDEKKKIREDLNKQIEIGNKELLEINKNIHNSLRKGIDCLFQLALKNNELNLLALKKDNEKYGYTKEILKENFQDKPKNQIYNVFSETLNDIEKLCEKEDTKEQAVNRIKETLLQNNKN